MNERTIQSTNQPLLFHSFQLLGMYVQRSRLARELTDSLTRRRTTIAD